VLAQLNKHDVLPVAFGVPPEVVDEIAGRTQAVRQLATGELQVIMQLVVVDVSGVARPVSGGVTVGIELCANPLRVPVPMTAAARRIAIASQQATLRPRLLPAHETPNRTIAASI
jgi:hypothetical protein